MNLNEEKGIKTGVWYANELLKQEDINILGASTYQNATDDLALRCRQRTADEVLSGFYLTADTLMSLDLTAGVAVSFTGYYMYDGTWEFVSDSGSVFSVISPLDEVVSITAADAGNPRIDIVEVRPIQTPYNPVSRQFKDAVTGAVSAATVNTRYEYGIEIEVRSGTPSSSPVADATTAGWIKIAEVYVGAAVTTITDNDITLFDDSGTWVTNTEGTVDGTRNYMASIVADLAGTGRTTETVKNNADDISSLAGTGRTIETVKDNADGLTDLAGVGRTTETVKGNADVIATNVTNIASNTATQRGHNGVNLTNWDDSTTAPLVSSGSVLEANGTVYLFSSDLSISTTGASSGTVYLVYDGSSFSWTSSTPSFDETLNGWYVSGDRFTGHMCTWNGSSSFTDKKRVVDEATDLSTTISAVGVWQGTNGFSCGSSALLFKVFEGTTNSSTGNISFFSCGIEGSKMVGAGFNLLDYTDQYQGVIAGTTDSVNRIYIEGSTLTVITGVTDAPIRVVIFYTT